MDGEIYFNMFKEPHPIHGKSEFLLKRWQKYTIYAKSGSYVRSNNPSQISILSSSIRPLTATRNYVVPDSPKANVYSTNSIYLYDYVMVSDTWFLSNVYTSSVVDFVPASDDFYVRDVNDTASFIHLANTWLNSPNSRTNEYLLTYDPIKSLPTWQGGMGRSIYGLPIIKRDDGTYFEIVRGYPRNHYTHKRGYFSLERFVSFGKSEGQITAIPYRKGQQLNSTTIGLDGISDGSDPVQATQVTNIDIIKSDNVIYH